MHFATQKDFEELNGPARAQEKRDERLASWKADPVFAKYNDDFFKKENLLTEIK